METPTISSLTRAAPGSDRVLARRVRMPSRGRRLLLLTCAGTIGALAAAALAHGTIARSEPLIIATLALLAGLSSLWSG
jgi:hypothetical protein